MTARRLKRPRDPIQLGKLIVEIATGQLRIRQRTGKILPPSPEAINHSYSPIHFMHYNFVRLHQSLRITPAMAAGATTKLW